MSYPTPFKVRALFDYNSDYDDDLPFRAEQVITVETIEDEEWFSGNFVDSNGNLQSGMFPRNFVEIIKPTDPIVPSRPGNRHHSDPSDSKIEREKEIIPISVESDAEDDMEKTPISSHQDSQNKPKANNTPLLAKTIEKDIETEVTKPKIENKFRDKISAFNVGTKAPMPFSKPKEDSYIKKQFIAAAPSSYIPQPFKNELKSKPKPQPQSTAPIINAESNTSDQMEEAAPKISLKERIALLQKTQQDEAERQQASLKKKLEKKEKEKKKKLPLEAIPHLDTENEQSKESHDEESKLLEELSSPVKSAPAIPNVPGSATQDHHSNEKKASAAHAEVFDEERESDTDKPVDANEEEDEVEEKEAEEDEEDTDDEEVRRRQLRERMAKISGGMGMFGMMGNPFGGAAPATPKKTKEKKDEPEEIAETIRPEAIAILPNAIPVALSTNTEVVDDNESTTEDESEIIHESSPIDSHKRSVDFEAPSVNEEKANRTSIEGITRDINDLSLEKNSNSSNIKDQNKRHSKSAKSLSEFEVTDAEEDEISEPDHHISQETSQVPPIPTRIDPHEVLSSSDNEELPFSPVINTHDPIELEPEVTGYDADEDRDSDTKTIGTAPHDIPPPIPHTTRIPSLPGKAPPKLPSTAPPLPAAPPVPPSRAPPIHHRSSLDQSTPVLVSQEEKDFDFSPNLDESSPRNSHDSSGTPTKIENLSRAQTFPINAPPPVPTANTKPSHTSSEFSRPARASVELPKVSRASSDLSHSGGLERTLSLSEKNNQQLAQDIHCDVSHNWWLRSELPDSLMNQVGNNIIYEVDDHEILKRGGTKLVIRDFYILYQDYSQTIIEIQFDPSDPHGTATIKQSHESSPILRKDLLNKYASAYGDKVANNATKLVGSRLPEDFVTYILGKTAGSLQPIGNKVFGATIYRNANNTNVHKYDDFRPGDILCIMKGKFQGLTKLRQKVEYEVGFGENPLATILVDFDQTKKKFRVIEQDSHGVIKKESYRLADFRSGRIRVFRVTGRDYVGW